MTQKKRQKEYRALLQQLSGIGWITEGYAQNRGRGAGGPCYQWTRKVKGKAVSVALSKEKYQWLSKAIVQWRQVKATLKKMQRLSRQFLFKTVPPPPRRKSLSQRVLGIK